MDALIAYIPEPEREIDKPFLMPVEGVFSISGRGTVATGRIEQGRVKVGEEVEIVGLGANNKTIVTGVEMFRKTLNEGQAGDNVGILLRGIKKEDIERGMVIAKPGTVKPHKKFKCKVYILLKMKVVVIAHSLMDIVHNFISEQLTLLVMYNIPEGREMVMPGDNVDVKVDLFLQLQWKKIFVLQFVKVAELLVQVL